MGGVCERGLVCIAKPLKRVAFLALVNLPESFCVGATDFSGIARGAHAELFPDIHRDLEIGIGFDAVERDDELLACRVDQSAVLGLQDCEKGIRVRVDEFPDLTQRLLI